VNVIDRDHHGRDLRQLTKRRQQRGGDDASAVRRHWLREQQNRFERIPLRHR
jgi:hypothetical protein